METTSSKVTEFPRVDTHLAKFSQGCVVVLTGLAFLLAQPVIVLIAATLVLFLTKATTLGLALDLIVFALAAINMTIGFCAGCLVYYYLGRIGLMPRVRYSGNFHWRGV